MLISETLSEIGCFNTGTVVLSVQPTRKKTSCGVRSSDSNGYPIVPGRSIHVSSK